MTIIATGTVPTSVATYKATVEQDVNRDGTYEATLFTTGAETLVNMPTVVVVPQDAQYRVTLDGFPASNAPASNGGSVAAGVTTINLATGVSSGSVSPSVVSRYTPTITLLNDSSLAAGQTVTMTGTNFSPAWVGGVKPIVSYMISGGSANVAAASVTVDNDTQIRVVVPADALDGNFKVTQDGIGSANSAYTMNPLLTLDGATVSRNRSFAVASDILNGPPFRNATGINLTCNFSANGSVSIGPFDLATYPFPGPNGNGNFYAEVSLLSAQGGALLVKRGSGAWELIGSNRNGLIVGGGESLRFAVNDNPVAHPGNSGTYTVTYACWESTP